MTAVAKIWHLLPHDAVRSQMLARSLGTSAVVAQLLLNRGIDQPEMARRFLDAPLSGLHPPALLPGLPEAVDRILRAVKDRRKICIYGDYDVDGTTGIAILLFTLRALGAHQTDFHVPHRLSEGYGLNVEALRQIREAGSSLLISVDCGIASLEEVVEAKRLGIETIITDHHEFAQQLPDADVIVHPRLPAGHYPFGELSGSGVALKLAWGLCQRACGAERVSPEFRELLLDCVALAALGTIADVVPLCDENRILVRFGLNRLLQHPSVGIKALLEATRLNERSSLKAADVGFKIAPRLNAIGRIGWARNVVELLTTTSQQRAADLARHLEKANEERQQLERKILIQAREQADLQAQSPALVLASHDWHAGIIGIVASRLVDIYARPVLLVSFTRDEAGNDTIGQGSGRSVPGFPLHEALAACTDVLMRHGGHHAAVGFKIYADKLDTFRSRFCAIAERLRPDGPASPRLLLDAEVPLNALTVGVVRDMDRLEPYGNQNRQPLFLAGGLHVVGEPRRVGQGERHLRFQVRQERTSLWCIAFGAADRMVDLMADGGKCSLAVRPQINEWNGHLSVQLEVQDFQAGPQASLG